MSRKSNRNCHCYSEKRNRFLILYKSGFIVNLRANEGTAPPTILNMIENSQPIWPSEIESIHFLWQCSPKKQHDRSKYKVMHIKVINKFMRMLVYE